MDDSSVLAFDTATADLVVGAARAGEVVFERTVRPGADGRPRHARELLAAVEEAAAAAGGWASVSRLGVGVGPGTFTGVRIGVATARALAQGLDVAPVAITSVDALARGAGAFGAGRLLAAAVDARRGEVFAALYEDGRAQSGPEVLAPGDLARRLGAATPPAVAVGDGSIRFRRELEAAGVRVPPDDEAVHRPSPRALCSLASILEPVSLEAIEPVYLRRPDAELWRERDGSGAARG